MHICQGFEATIAQYIINCLRAKCNMFLLLKTQTKETARSLHDLIHSAAIMLSHTHRFVLGHNIRSSYIKTKIHTYMHTKTHTPAHAYIHIKVHTYMHTHTLHMCMTYIHTCMQCITYIHTYMHTHIHTYTHT